VGLDPHKRLAKVDKDGDVEDIVGVEVEVLDPIVPEHPLEEVARRQCESALHRSCKHWDLIRIFLHRVWIPGGDAPKIHLLFAKETAVDQGEEVLGLQFRLPPLLRWIRRSGEGRDNDDWPASLASLRILFFDALVLVLFDDDAFILPVTSVFTRICSAAAGVGGLWWWHGSKSNLLSSGGDSSGGDNSSEGGSSLDLITKKCNCLK
jgi:hypothetical protein